MKPVLLTRAELRAVELAVGDRLAAEWDVTFPGEGTALESASRKLRAALAATTARVDSSGGQK